MAGFAEGAPCWAEAMLPDVEAGKRFYGELFGWTFGDSDPALGDYTEAFLDGESAAALMPKQDGRMPTAWSVHFATPDAAAGVRKVREAGGSIVSDVMDVQEFGRMAVAAGPDGAVFSLWEAGTHPGFGVQDVPGAFCWTEVLTRDAEAADAFYPAVFGYQLQDPPFDAGDFKSWALPGSGREVAGRAVIGDDTPAEMPPHFLLYFRVADVGQALGTVRSNGGRVVSGPEEVPAAGFAFAVAADDQGAVFALMDGAPKD